MEGERARERSGGATASCARSVPVRHAAPYQQQSTAVELQLFRGTPRVRRAPPHVPLALSFVRRALPPVHSAPACVQPARSPVQATPSRVHRAWSRVRPAPTCVRCAQALVR